MTTPHGTLFSPRYNARRVLDMPGAGSYELVNQWGYPVNKSYYSRSPWAFACMQIRSSELANLPWRITKGGKILDAHPVIDMLSTFGDESNYAESMQATEIDLLMIGKAFWLRDADKLKRLLPQTIEVKASRDGISGFVQTIDGKVVNRFERGEVCYFREYNPDSDLQPGIPVMEVVSNAVSIEYESGLHVEAFFKNDATPAMLITTEQTVQDKEMNRVKMWWENAFKGSRKAHKVAFADKGLQAKILATSMRDMALTEIRDQARNDICAGMRVPKILVGAMEEATYANAQEARKYMLEDLIIPRATYFADVINAELVRQVDPSVVFEFAPQDLQILQEGLNEKWKRLSDALVQGSISQEFARSQMGWPESSAPSEAPRPATAPEALPAEEAEMRAWRRKAAKALHAGRGANVPFECRTIKPEREQAIRAALEHADLDDLDWIFDEAMDVTPILKEKLTWTQSRNS